LGLTAGLVPPRVDAPVKAGLLELVAHAHAEAGWSVRRCAALLGIEHTRLARWACRALSGQLADANRARRVRCTPCWTGNGPRSWRVSPLVWCNSGS